jgi:hypothetical protein
MRLKARVYLWAESTDVEKLAAGGGDWPSEAVLASLFRDLGADRALDYSSVEEDAPMTAARAATPASPESERDRLYSRAFMNLEPKIRDPTHMAELARFHAIETFG